MLLFSGEIRFRSICTYETCFSVSQSIFPSDPQTLAATSLSLASKYEEEHIKVRDLINVTYRYVGSRQHWRSDWWKIFIAEREPSFHNFLSLSTLHPQRSQLRISDEYHRLRNTLMDCELFLIRILGFHFQFNHPNKYLLHYLDTLSKWMAITPATPMKNNTNLVDIAMSILQDTYYDYVLIRDFAPQHIAIAIIYLLIKTYALEIPSVTEDDEHITWMKVSFRSKSVSRRVDVCFSLSPSSKVFSSSMTNEILVQIINRINTVYKHVERTLDPGTSTASA